MQPVYEMLYASEANHPGHLDNIALNHLDQERDIKYQAIYVRVFERGFL